MAMENLNQSNPQHVTYVTEDMSEVEKHHRTFLMLRGVEIICQPCNGKGVRAYGNTSTWRRGIGGQAITNGVCDSCWGSGDANRHWVNLRQMESTVRRLEKELRELHTEVEELKAEAGV